MTSASKLPTRHVLRGILRHLNKQPPASTTTTESQTEQILTTTQSFVLEKFRSSSSSTSPSSSQSSLLFAKEKLARDYFMLKTDLAERERLQKLDTGAELQLSPKEMSRRAAARAGLQLPEAPDL